MDTVGGVMYVEYKNGEIIAEIQITGYQEVLKVQDRPDVVQQVQRDMMDQQGDHRG